MNEKSKWKKVIKNNLFLCGNCFKADPKYMILFVINAFRKDLVIFLEFTFGLNFVLESAEFRRPFIYVFSYLCGLFIFVVVGMLFDSWMQEKYTLKVMPIFKLKLKKILFTKAKEVDLEYYDNPNYYNNFILAISESDNQIERIFTLINNVVSSVSTFVLTGTFFLFIDKLSFIFIFFIFGASFIMNQLANNLNFNIRLSRNFHERKRDYINRTFYLAEYAKEIRLNTKISDCLFHDFDETNTSIYEIEMKNAKKRFIIDFLKVYVCNSFLHDIVYVVYLVYRAMILHIISYSNIVVLFRASTNIKKSMQLFSTIYPYAAETSLYVDKINHFLETETKIINEKGKKIPVGASVLELKHVYFSYSNDENYVLKDVNITINGSNKVALVGVNGAGKTTLIKLIMRLYDVTKGEILLDGVNIKDYDLEDYRRKIGAVFQDYRIYALSLMENVVLDLTSDSQREGVLNSLRLSGFEKRYETLPNGLDTQLTTEFEESGINLSGGESQKIAIARLFYKNNEIAILDEPSSALDPISEYELNNTIMDVASNKMIVLISHRLSTTRLSDYIYLLDGGEVAEQGTHKELLAMNGMYCKMWNVQASNYSDLSATI